MKNLLKLSGLLFFLLILRPHYGVATSKDDLNRGMDRADFDTCSDTIQLGIQSSNSYCGVGPEMLSDFYLNANFPLPPGGTWVNPNGEIVVGGWFDETDESGQYIYYYANADGCTVALGILMNIQPEGSAGFPPNTVELCHNSEPFKPWESLLGTPPSWSGNWLYFSDSGEFLYVAVEGSPLFYEVDPSDYDGNGNAMVDGYFVYIANSAACGFSYDTLYVDLLNLHSETICWNDSTVELLNLLEEVVPPGGEWTDFDGNGVDGSFTPYELPFDSLFTVFYSGDLAEMPCSTEQDLEVTIPRIRRDTVEVLDCPPFLWELSSEEYTEEGFYEFELSVPNRCDSLIVLDFAFQEDSVPPSVSCQGGVVFLDENGEAEITIQTIQGQSSDSCGVVEETLFPNSFTLADVGLNTVVYTSIDWQGNESTCTTQIKVVSTLNSSDLNHRDSFDVKLAPNPSSGKFTVLTDSFLDDSFTIEIFDGAGRLVKSNLKQRSNLNLDLSELSEGLYFCTLRSEKYTVTKRLMIVR